MPKTCNELREQIIPTVSLEDAMLLKIRGSRMARPLLQASEDYQDCDLEMSQCQCTPTGHLSWDFVAPIILTIGSVTQWR